MGSNKDVFHFIGIGGSGMSGIAKILVEQGYKVSGSDLKDSKTTQGLEELGATVFIGHKKENIAQDVTKVVVSTAVNKNNVEVIEANNRNIPIIHRGEMLAYLMDKQKGIAIAGAHGKTTTTSMTGIMFENCNLNPTIVVGGHLSEIGGNAKFGAGEYLIAEADESDGSFLKLNPLIAVITNIEPDHLDYYGSLDKIINAFEKFINKISDNGLAILCYDDANVRDLAEKCNKEILSYGINHEADFMAKNISFDQITSTSDIYFRGEKIGVLELNVPGVHNIKNALAVVATGWAVGLSFDEIAKGLHEYRGVGRRFQLLGEVNGIKVVDDYAHHPTEVQATLAAAKQTKANRVIGVFQPHRYTRTNFLQKEFGEAFPNADIIVINDIYSAGEEPIAGVTAQLVVKAIEENEGRKVHYCATIDDVVNLLNEIAEPGDLILTMGAGNIWTAGTKLVEKLKERTTVA